MSKSEKVYVEIDWWDELDSLLRQSRETPEAYLISTCHF